MKTKKIVKQFLRNNFNDTKEYKWILLLTLIYVIPMLSTGIYYMTRNFNFYNNLEIQILIGGIGFLLSIIFTTLFLNVYFLISKKTYEDIIPPKWQKQITKIGGLSALSALAEEMFFRLFLPAYLLKIFPFHTALIISSLLFIILQVLYVETTTQRIVLGIAGLSISLVSGTVVYFGYPISALLVHTIYIIFYAKAKNRKAKYAKN